MATHKIVKIIGIHATEEFYNASDEAANAIWKQITRDPDFVAGAIFRGGQVAPLSGQKFWLIEAKACKRPPR